MLESTRIVSSLIVSSFDNPRDFPLQTNVVSATTHMDCQRLLIGDSNMYVEESQATLQCSIMDDV